jgi:glyoxylase-like metal-dependent hydrolase (beta-lactamase superfamily II)
MDIDNLAADADTFTSNAYLVDDTALVDAGAAPTIVSQLEHVDLETVVITHSHHDHVENLPQIVSMHDPAVYAYNPANISVSAEQIADGDTIGLAGYTFQVFHTPGHKHDSICLYNEAEKILFSGDLVFPNGWRGRTDLPGSHHEDLVASIERITRLDVDALYAGHDPPATTAVNEQIQDALAHARRHEQPNK